MPTYEYVCLKCSKEFEVFQSMKDAPLAVCTCGKKGKVRRKIGGGAGLIFKGTGFYQTDYKRGAAAKQESGDKARESSAASAAKPESKPAPKEPKS
jgi:putative FmdB family regulatory protein